MFSFKQVSVVIVSHHSNGNSNWDIFLNEKKITACFNLKDKWKINTKAIFQADLWIFWEMNFRKMSQKLDNIDL